MSNLLSKIKRTHITSEREVIIRQSYNADVTHKPKGFWYSVNGDWERWCRSEEPGWLKGYQHEVTLGNENLLVIRTQKQLDRFHDEYSANTPPLKKKPYIDWFKVARAYDGIEISQYFWDRRLDLNMLWYYTWDCASGCIWRPKGVKVKLIKKLPKPKGDRRARRI